MTDYIRRAKALADFEACNAENPNWTPQRVKRNVGIVDSPNGHCFEHDIDTNGQDFCSYGEKKGEKPE